MSKLFKCNDKGALSQMDSGFVTIEPTRTQHGNLTMYTRPLDIASLLATLQTDAGEVDRQTLTDQ